jgi:hypothetical protein
VTQNWFASSIAEERLVARGGRLQAEFSRFDRGWARARLRGNWIEIDAGDTHHTRGMPESIAAHLASPNPAAPSIALDPESFAGWQFHAITRHRIAVHRGSEPEEQLLQLVVATATARDHGHVSIVSTPESLARETRRLAALLSKPAAGASSIEAIPIAFVNGSAAVLMHEALGHPSEHGAPHVAWPSWLVVADDPGMRSLGYLPLDDCGRPVAKRELTRGDRPTALRRWSFRDTPIVRMSNLSVSGSGSPVALPSRRVEVQLVEHGGWDPLTDEVSIRVSLSELVEGRERGLLPRFTLRLSRRDLAARLAGWFGETVVYPGVICSDEGQSLPVGSVATGLLLQPR